MITNKLWTSLAVFVTIFGSAITKSALRSKRNAPGEIESILESQIKSFPAESFALDMEVIQRVDRANKISHYKFINEEENVYERSHDDGSKDVIVLSQEEDKLPFKNTKRSYVVLKKSPQSLLYYAELALVRDATPQDKNPVSVNGTNRVIEWIYYDDHVIHGRSPVTLTALTCVSSILVPCMFNEAALTPPEKFVTAKRFAAKQSPRNVLDEIETAKLKTEDGSDSDDNYDLYVDLQTNKVQGRGVFDGIITGGLFPGLLATAGGLICGVLTIIGTCGKKAGTDTVIVNQSGVDLTPEQIQEAMLNAQMGRRRKRAPGEPDLDKVLDYPGWKTQYVHPSTGITFQHDAEIFFGFGNCPYVPIKPEDLIGAKSQDEILNYYLKVLRAGCILHTKPLLDALITDKLLVLNDKAFDLVSEHKSLNDPKLTLKHLLSLSSATEFSAFSQVYSQTAQNPAPAADQKTFAPDGQTEISRSIHFIVKVGLTYIKITREKTRSHILHLTRNLLNNFDGVFGKLAQDNQNLENCSECNDDKQANLKDRLHVMSLIQFIKRGLGPVERGADVFKSFNSFFMTNQAELGKFVANY